MSDETGRVERAVTELPVAGGDGLSLSGYAAVYNQRAAITDHLGTYDEVIKPGAFTRSINARTPFLLFQHGRHPFIGQFPLGTIETLREDDKGLYVEARLVDTPMTAPVRDAIKAGAITGMSVAMESPKNGATWSKAQDGTQLRTVNEAKLFELGPVLGPAYTDTSVAVRSMLAELPEEVRREVLEANYPDLETMVRSVVEIVLDERNVARSTGTPEEPADGTSEGPADTPETEGPAERTPSTQAERQQIARAIQIARRDLGKKRT